MDIRRIITSFSILAVCSIMTIGVPAPATAQSIGSKWQIEIHGAAMLPRNQTGGTTKLPPPGETIPTAGIYGPPAPPVLVLASSRRVSSWYFGDGAVLFDQASTAVAANPVAMTAPFPGRIVALDPVLETSLGAVDRGAGIGVRLTRAMTPRFDVELSVDYSVTRMHVTDANRDAIEATRASFIPAFQGVIVECQSHGHKPDIRQRCRRGQCSSPVHERYGPRQSENHRERHTVCRVRRWTRVAARRPARHDAHGQLPVLEYDDRRVIQRNR